MPIGDSVGAGYGGQWNIISGRPAVEWAVIQQLFARDRIDAGTTADEFSVQMLGTEGCKTYSMSYNEIPYKFETFNEGRGGWGVTTYLYQDKDLSTPWSNPFYDGSITGKNKFSLKSYLKRYRTYDDEGNRLSRSSPDLGTYIRFDQPTDYINYSGIVNGDKACVNTPTHIIIQLGLNDIAVDRINYIENMRSMIARIKEEFPDMIIGISLSDAFGTYFPEFYPEYEFSSGMSLFTYVHQIVYEWTSELMSLENPENGVFFIPNYFIQPSGEGVPYIEVETADGKKIKVNAYDTTGYHPNNIAHYAWGYEIYAWLKYTLTL